MLLDLLDRFQTLAAASIALLGVVLTLTFTAYANRRQFAQQKEKEAASILIAIYGELTHMAQTMRNQKEALENREYPSEESFLVPSRRLDRIFETLMPHVGKLRPAQLEKILNAYAQYDVYYQKLFIIGRVHASQEYFVIPNDLRSVVAAHNQHIIDRVQETLSAKD